MGDLISVIIPVYNSENTLKRCLDSVINQTYRNLEIILIESASVDRSAEICDEYASVDSRVHVLHQNYKKGLSNARNEGLKLVHGDFVGYVDSDDWIAPNMYKELLYALKKTNSDIAGGQVQRMYAEESLNPLMDDGTLRIKEYSQKEFAEFYFKIKTNRCVFTVWNKIYKVEIAKAMHFPEGRIAEDVEGFYWAMYHASKIVLINRVVYYYWYRPDSLSSEWFSKKQMDALYAWRNVYKYTVKNKKKEWYYYARINYYRSFFGMLCRLILSGESKKYEKEKKYLLRNLRKHYFELLFSPMNVFRKIAMTSMAVSYPVTERVYWLLRKKGLISDQIGVM